MLSLRRMHQMKRGVELMNKAYNPINWVNNETPINETNLNKMSNGLSAVDDRVIALNKTLGSYSDKINEALEASVVAQDAKEIALESAEKAEEALKNAEAVVGVGIATKDKAGLVKADDVHIASDGTLKFIEKTTSTTMPNSHNGRLLVEEIGGACEQRTTTGTQLFDANALGLWTNKSLTVSSDEYTITAVGGTTAYANSFVTIDTNLVAGKTVYLKADSISNNAIVQLNIVNADGTNSYCPIYSGSLVRSISIPEDVTDVSLRIYTNNSPTALEADITVTVKGLLLSFTDAEWEPYTGGIPAPNPDYPMEIKKSVVKRVRTHAKNMVDFRKCVTKTNSGVTYNVQEDGSFKRTGTCTNAVGNIWFLGNYSQAPNEDNVIVHLDAGETYFVKDCTLFSNTEAITNQYTNLGQVVTIDKATYPDGVDITGIRNTYLELNKTYDDIVYPLVCKSSKATEWEPYNGSEITLSSPIELCRIGDVQDVIDVENGVVRKKIKKVVFDGSEDEGWINNTIGEFVRFQISVNATPLKKRTKCLCDKAFFVSSGNAVNMCFIYDSSFYIAVEQTITTLGDFKNWLAGNPMTVIYELATEEVTDLPTADRIALNSLDTYNGITYLEFDSEIEPTFKCEYGTSKVGGYTLEGLLTGRNAELLQQSNADRITALETALINNV